jgi:hypothetical protein
LNNLQLKGSFEPNHCQHCNRTFGGSTFTSATSQFSSSRSSIQVRPVIRSKPSSSISTHQLTPSSAIDRSAVGSPRTTPQLSPSQLQNMIESWPYTLSPLPVRDRMWRRLSLGCDSTATTSLVVLDLARSCLCQLRLESAVNQNLCEYSSQCLATESGSLPSTVAACAACPRS